MVVLGREGALEIDVVYVCVCFDAVSVFDDELKKHGGSCARASFSESLRRWAKDFVFFGEGGGNVGDYTGPEFVYDHC